MPDPIPAHHPLRALFTQLVRNRLSGTAQVTEHSVVRYVAGLLVDFCHADHLYRLRDSRGWALVDVGEMLIRSNPLLEGRSFLYERELRKHIGDYILFVAGLFPEYLARVRRQSLRLDSMIDYLKAGRESYAIVAEFDQFEFKEAAPLFRRLSDQFELCVFGLNLVKQDLEQLQHASYRRAQVLLG